MWLLKMTLIAIYKYKILLFIKYVLFKSYWLFKKNYYNIWFNKNFIALYKINIITFKHVFNKFISILGKL